jgi:hypothetical protein
MDRNVFQYAVRSKRTCLLPSLLSKARKVSSERFVPWKDNEPDRLAEARPATERPSHGLHPLRRDAEIVTRCILHRCGLK